MESSINHQATDTLPFEARPLRCRAPLDTLPTREHLLLTLVPRKTVPPT